MEQLLRSIGRINYAKQIDNRHFQAHIFFDSGARGFRLTEFALQLICMVKKALGLSLKKKLNILFKVLSKCYNLIGDKV